MLRCDVITLFPELIESVILSSVTGNAVEEGIFELHCHDLRPYGEGSYLKTDDRLFGGGSGMLMMAEPIYRAWLACKGELESCRTLYLSPKGKVFNQAVAKEFSQEEHLIFLCGHYEGVDDRVLEAMNAEEVSLGDFVLTGGEIAACAMIDATARLLPGVLAGPESYEEESHYYGLLECRQYTQPALWRGREVPEVLRSGHHARIERWRLEDSLRETMIKRPDLLASRELSDEEIEILSAMSFEDVPQRIDIDTD